MSSQSTSSKGQETYYQKRHWLIWVIFALILIAVPINFISSSINPMQKDLEQCNLNMELRQIPGNDLPPYSIDEFNRCADAGSKASTYFFLTSLMILFNFTALEGLMAMRKRAAYAYTLGLLYVVVISLVMSGQFPAAFISLNLPIVLLLWIMVYKKRLI